MSHQGWMGTKRELLHYLSMVDADCDQQGNYLLAGDPVVVGLGGQEVVITAGTYYLREGKPVKLVPGLRETSYGLGVLVY